MPVVDHTNADECCPAAREASTLRIVDNRPTRLCPKHFGDWIGYDFPLRLAESFRQRLENANRANSKPSRSKSRKKSHKKSAKRRIARIKNQHKKRAKVKKRRTKK